ncbi:hypothetical protein [Nocardioides imazamoxiresistens]|uniref:hypothetical protein n=1 Tax=Nocardioides imazamoxiresistens TaxID=3231893 RepID=UPI0028E3AFB5|nr:hypothetical protein [Nocardioides zeae]
MTALVTAGLVAAPQVASAAEPDVLRTVDVTIGDDGSVTAVRSTLVTDTDGRVEQETEELAPSSVDLPVRVLTSYRSDDGAGTDLSDLAGYSGPLTIDVTVQNTTVRTESLEYTSNGAGVREYAQIGSPLTVVGGVALPGATRVVTGDAGGTGGTGDTGGTGTNGVLGQDAEGTQVVQWSALLAPPQLAATATFRLALDVDDFEVPTFDLAVQPGLVTDPSVEALLTSAFAERPGSSRTLQLATLATISNVNATLDTVGTSLDEISTALSATATSFGTNARAGLETASGSLEQRIDGTIGELGSASSTLDATISAARADGVTSLADSLEQIRGVLGTGPAGPGAVPTPGTPSACTGGGALEPADTLLGLLASIRGSLDAYGSATEQCRATLVADLRASVGDLSQVDGAGCASGAGRSAICVLADARGGIDGALAELAGLATAVTDAQVSTDAALGDVVDTIGGLRSAVAAVGTSLDGIGGAGVDGVETAVDDVVAEATGALGDLRDQLVALQGLTAANGSLAAGIGELADTATAQLALVGPGGSLRSGIDALLGLVCGTPVGTVSQDLLDLLASVVDLQVCPEESESVVADLDLVEDAWGAVAALVGTGTSALPALLAEIDAALLPLLGSLDAVVGSLEAATADDGAVTAAFAGLAGQLDALTGTVESIVGAPVATGTCDTPVGTPASFEDLDALWERAQCRLDATETAVGGYVAAANQSFADADGSLVTTARGLESVRGRATGSLNGFLGDLVAGLDATGTTAQAAGEAQAERIDADATASTQGTRDRLTGTLDGARRTLTADLGATQADLGGTQASLAADLARVLAALGAPIAADGTGGAGIIGALGRNSVAASSSLGEVTEANGSTAEFGARRALDLRAIDRSQQQFLRAKDREDELSRDGVDATAGTVRTVFTFHVGGR